MLLYENMPSSAHKSIDMCDNIYFFLKLGGFFSGA